MADDDMTLEEFVGGHPVRTTALMQVSTEYAVKLVEGYLEKDPKLSGEALLGMLRIDAMAAKRLHRNTPH